MDAPLSLRPLPAHHGYRAQEQHDASYIGTDQEETMTQTYTDPVCGMTVEPDKAAATHEYQGQTYYFCSKGCAKSFEADPTKYLTAS